jgi:type IV pilus assembly protein PilA
VTKYSHQKLNLTRLWQLWQVSRWDQYKDKGFTLIELMIVIIFIGILAALSLPVLFAQVGRARESETKSNLSTVGQAQQAYFFENGIFANDYSLLDVTFQGNYYTYPQPILLSFDAVIHRANPIDGVNKATRTFSLGVYYTDLSYDVILCRSSSTLTPTDAPNAPTEACSNAGTREF